MANKTINARTVQKHDTTANWDLAVDFIPLEGEIIVYTDINKIKVGDGETVVGELPWASGEMTDMTGATTTTDGSHGLVPAPLAGDQNKFLRGDGTWAEAGGGGGSSSQYTQDIIGDGETSQFSINHNLNDRNLMVLIYDALYNDIICDIERTNLNTYTLTFNEAPATGVTYHVIIRTPGGEIGPQGPAGVNAVSFDVTLTVSDWNNNQQIISDARFVTTGFDFVISPKGRTEAQKYIESGILFDNISTDGQVISYCETTPISNITCSVLKVEVG